MIFKKKKMVDVRDLQKKGMISPTSHEPVASANKEGFVDFSKRDSEIRTPLEVDTNTETTSTPQVEAPANVFGFMNTPAENSTSDPFSTESNGYSKREVDEKIEQLDNKVYKMEQRIELLERKAGVGSNNSQPTGTGLW